MEESAQVRRRVRAAVSVPPIEQKALDGWGTSLGNLLPRSFFEAVPELVAPRLLGKVLAHTTPAGILAGRIVEAEAYLGPHNDPPDAAAHSYRGPTPRNSVIFGPAGHAYVYAIYGRYFCMNVVCEIEGQAGCVLLRALEPVLGMEQMAANRGLTNGVAARQLTAGPSRLCQALGLTRLEHNGLDLVDSGSTLQLRDDGFTVSEVLVTARIGINAKNAALDWPLRFALPNHDCVSGPKSLIGNRVPLRVEFRQINHPDPRGNLPFENYFPVCARRCDRSRDSGFFLCCSNPSNRCTVGRRTTAEADAELSRADQPESPAEESDGATGARHYGELGRFARGALRHLPHGGPQEHRAQRTSADELCRRLEAGEEFRPVDVHDARRHQCELRSQGSQLRHGGNLRHLPSRPAEPRAVRGSGGRAWAAWARGHTAGRGSDAAGKIRAYS
jgi:DNA-3-methyladenine glycosylase